MIWQIGFWVSAGVNIILAVFTSDIQDWRKRKRDKHDSEQVALRHLKLKLKKYSGRLESLRWDIVDGVSRTDVKRIETLLESQEIFEKIEEDLIHCPPKIQPKVDVFKGFCQKKHRELHTAQLGGFKNPEIIEKIDREISQAYEALVKDIDKLLK